MIADAVPGVGGASTFDISPGANRRSELFEAMGRNSRFVSSPPEGTIGEISALLRRAAIERDTRVAGAGFH
jgi:hypothetical protein